MQLQNCNLSLQMARNYIKFVIKFTKMRWRLWLCPRPRWGTQNTPQTPCMKLGFCPDPAGGANGTPRDPLPPEEKSAEPQKVHFSKIRPFTKS